MHEWRHSVFGSSKSDSGDDDRGHSTGQGGNGNTRNPLAIRKHVAITTPHRDAVRDLATGSDYRGRHRAE
jgi:hypothetical protein